jgi:succinate dehydrogenase/fumarate reductase flavoprotein subunit
LCLMETDAMNEKVESKEVNRRTFLKGAVAGIGAIGIAGLSSAEAKTLNLHQVPKWDYTTDVVVIGYGAAGGNAAIAAHDAGAKVILIDKMPIAGGNSGVCGGIMAIPYTVADAIHYYRGLSFGTVDEEMIRGFAEAIVGTPDLLNELGATFKGRKGRPFFPTLLNADLQHIHFDPPTGKGGMQFLARLVEKRGIKVMLKTPAKGLIQAPETGDLVGVKAESEGTAIHIKANKGVVLACGGYENNPEMFAYYNFPGLKDFIFPYGTPGNSGDGLKMAAAAGAQLWHTAALQWGGFCAKAPSKQFGVAVGGGIPREEKSQSFVFVNKYGKRFMRETKRIGHTKEPLDVLYFDHAAAEYPNVPAYMVFDEACRNKGHIYRAENALKASFGGPMGYATVHKIYEWSNYNSAEIDKGWIIKADTIKDLAERIKVDPKGLEGTISKFNSYCTAGKDLEFARGKNSLEPIMNPPYYAIEMGLALVNTQGGPKHNKFCQVLDPDDKPIPRLYVAGELGSFFGFLYQGGSNYPEAWAFGRIAGKQAASEKPFQG